MTRHLLNEALTRLSVLLRLEDADADTTLLTALLEQAESRVCCYLGRALLPDYALQTVIELATLRYYRTDTAGGKRSESYSEGELSQSESYLTPQDFAESEAALLRTLSSFRQVRTRGGVRS